MYRLLARALLILHALLATAQAGAVTHLALVTLGFLRGGRQKLRLGRIYALTAGSLHLVTVGVGLLVYPTYRYWVAGLYLNRHAPWAANLFDVKEAAGLFGIPLAIGLIIIGRKFGLERSGRPVKDASPNVEFDATDKPALPAFALCALGLWALDAFCIVSGLLITAERGV